MSIKVVFLGTSGSIPTLKRSLPSVLVKSSREQWMFDCGEGVQRQMIQAKVGFHKKLRIFITHLHGDHVLGLPGLLQTMALMERKEQVQIYAPVGFSQFLLCAKETLNFGLTYPFEVYEISEEGTISETAEFKITAFKANHSVNSYAFAFEEKPRCGEFYPKKALALGIPEGELWSRLQKGNEIKAPNGRIVKPTDVMGPTRLGRKIVYTGDTKPFDGFAKHAKNADLIIHDCTFDDSLAEKADKDGHSTPTQAALQAKAADAKRLVLTHISARYPDANALLEQAKKVFPDTLLGEDFMSIELPSSE